MKKIFNHARIYTGTTVLENHSLAVDGKFITAIYPSSEESSLSVIEANTYDVRGMILAPAFIDLQIYGAAGRLLNNERTRALFDETHRYNLSGGTTRYQITLSTHSPQVITESIQLCEKALGDSLPGFLGLHLEGPFINPIKRGAHLEEHIQTPTLVNLEQIVSLGKNAVKMMTIAPEYLDLEMLNFLSKTGWIISAGHSNATYNQAIKGFEGGIQTSTHLFNAMSPLQSREPGLTGAAFCHSNAMASIIADGIHCDYSSLRIAKMIMGNRLFLITDAVTVSQNGPYCFYEGKNCYVNEKGTLCGSALSMIQAVRNCVQYAGISLEEALRMASTFPANLIGRNDLGNLRPGTIADLLILDKELNIKQVYYEGELIQ